MCLSKLQLFIYKLSENYVNNRKFNVLMHALMFIEEIKAMVLQKKKL